MKIPEYRTEERKNKIIEVIKKRRTDITLIAENINDPHNLSAMLRTCDAVGIFEINLIYTDIQPYPKLGVKSSASAMKWVKVNKFKNVESCYNYVKQKGMNIYTTKMDEKAVSLYDLDLTKPTALVFGNEHRGVSEEACLKADKNFLIPQVGVIQSLNVSVACAVSLYEAFRQKIIAGQYNFPDFSEDELNRQINYWLSV